MEVTITTENFESYKNGDLPLVVDLWATWCGPCRMVGPIISELAKEYDGKLVVGKCDVEENDEIAATYPPPPGSSPLTRGKRRPW